MDRLIEFIRESNRIEGIIRDPSEEEISAMRAFLELKEIRVEDLQTLVWVFARAHLREREGMDVGVGNHFPPRGGPKVRMYLQRVLDDMKVASPYGTHQAYEYVHPFMDGNGRSGRALWLWQMGGEAPLGFLHTWYYQSLGSK